MKKIKQYLSVFLIICLCLGTSGTSVLASDEFELEGKAPVMDTTSGFDAEGTDPVGDMLASVIREEQEKVGSNKNTGASISVIKVEGNKGTVEFQTNTEADLVVAIYDE